MAARTLLAAGLLAAVIAAAGATFHMDFMGEATAAAAHSQLRAQGRSLAQDANDTVCYEGCLVPPVDDPAASPLPTLLFKTTAPATLLDCYYAAVAAQLSNFAISNITSCYGGNSPVLGWALDPTCSLDCVPGGPASGICGGVDKASVFSVGLCLRLDVPCQPETSAPSSPSQPLSPVSPSPPPSPGPSPPPPRPPPVAADQPAPLEMPDFPSYGPPPPSPPPPAFACRDDTSLWGDELTKIKLSPKSSSAVNAAACRAYCLAEPACKGFYYKTTQWCYLMSKVYGYKQYGTSVTACKLAGGGY